MASDDMIRAPIQHGMRTLDRSKFHRVVPLKAARIRDIKNISRIRDELSRSRDALPHERISCVRPDPDPERARIGQKCLLLRSETMPPSKASHSPDEDSLPFYPYSSTLRELEKQELITVIPYQVQLDYSYWTYHEIISAILPLDDHGEIPSGFSQVGHVAHLNLREGYLKYKYLIAEILMDKNPNVRTVINKTDDVGEENEFRTFRYELLAGSDDLDVTLSEENCIFKFNYSKVYWNTRLNTEHRRLVHMFQPGEAVCDVMTGIGPFAVPAGKKGVFVWANDLNPDSFNSLQENITRNKVSEYVRPYNEDGRSFIRTSAIDLVKSAQEVKFWSKPSKQDRHIKPEVLRVVPQPKTFQHYVLNLPASAITFLPSFVGLYPDSVRQQLPDGFAMPLIHVYCFSTKSADNVEEAAKICQEIKEQIGFDMHVGNLDELGGVEIYDVRDVSPKKRMFCASFRLPEEVAFRTAS